MENASLVILPRKNSFQDYFFEGDAMKPEMKPTAQTRRILSLWLLLLALVSSSCVSYESSLRSRYGYNNSPQQQQQPYYAPQSQVPLPQNSPQYYGQGYNQNPNQGYNQNPNQGYGQNPNQGYGQPLGSNITFQTFYNELSPFGEWISTPEYGYVWRPYGIDAAWRPYLNNGRWVYTEYAWTWVSDYIWGWAPFHYGRWRLDPFYGWVWHPGNVWGPAWVEWRTWNGNYCWAPLGLGVSIGAGFRGGNYHWSAWNVVPGRFFTQRNLWNHCLPYSQVNTFINNTTIINNTTVINNNTYFTGPAMTDVERYSGKVIPLALRNLNKVALSTVDDNSVSIYRPDVAEYSGKAQNTAFRPAAVTPANQATIGKASILFSQTPENADQNAPQKSTPITPNTNSRDANNPFIMPAPSGKAVPDGFGGGHDGKAIPMPAPIEVPQNPATPNETGVPKANPSKQIEQPQNRDVPYRKSNPFGTPPPPSNTSPQIEEQQQREAAQKQEQQRQQEQGTYQKQVEDQTRYQKQVEEQQRQQEQRTYQKQVDDRQQREAAQKQEQQRQQEQRRQEEQQRKEEQQRQREEPVKKTAVPAQEEVKKSPFPPPGKPHEESTPKKKEDSERQ